MIGTTISRYEVLEKLGEGGMGVVFKARDLKLGRFVAVKVLLDEGEGKSDRRARFLQEARAASSLNHPNIVTIYEIFSLDRGECIAMEFVRGETLAGKIAARALPKFECLRIGMQISDALAAAHAIGIVHRDLKPANVMVTPEGNCKVLDFGLAKLVTVHASGKNPDSTESLQLGPSPQTAEGAIIGTVAYMSPEQAQGLHVDWRSDIFSLGSIIHELFSGEKAFHGDSGLSTLTAVLRDQPKDLAQLGVDAPEVQEVIWRCLKKDPDQRYQSMGEVRNALEQIYFATRSGVTHVSRLPTPEGKDAPTSNLRPAFHGTMPSIAVLPFVNMSSDRENDYFSDGLAEEIINALTKLDNLRVTARTSAFAFRGSRDDIRKIGRTLNVSSVLDGSVRKSGNRVRVIVQLISPEDGNNLWSERFDRQITDVFDIQDEISAAIVETLKVRLAGHSDPELAASRPAPPLVKRFTGNLAAYNLYLKGRYEVHKMTREGLDLSKKLFQEAIALDPDYAVAHDGLAYCWYSEGFLGFIAPKEAMPRAKSAVHRAIELDESVAEAHATLGVILALYDWDWAGAERELIRSIELNGSSPASRDMYAFYFLRPVGRIEEAIHETQHALTLDPLSILYRVHLGYLYFVHRNYEMAIVQFRKVLEMNPNYYLAHAMMAPVYTMTRRFDEAMEAYAKAREADANSKFVASLEAATLAAAGRNTEAKALLGLINARAAAEYISPVSIAYIYTALNDSDAAFECLDRGVHDRDPNILGLKSNPLFDGLRGDPRYRALLRKMQLEHSGQAVYGHVSG